MALQPSASVGIGLATAGLVMAIHAQATPSMADIRVGEPNDDNIDRSERAATWMSVGAVSLISLLLRDPMIFIIGGATAVGMAWWTRHGNMMNPLTQSASYEGFVQRANLGPVPPEETADSNFGAATGF